jgi:FKBP-type peptidyl-prolyl cis-trans isomerase
MRILALAFTLAALPLFATTPPVPPADLTNPPKDAVRGEDGLITRVLREGAGTERLDVDGVARVRYTVWKSDGTLVQDIPEPRSIVIDLAKMLPGWRTAAQMMAVGEVRRAWIPEGLGGGKIAAGEVFVIDTELIEVIQRPETPADVAAPPAEATTTGSGLAWKALRDGHGIVRPNRRSTVVVHYTGWTTDGRMFDSSVLRGEPATFPLSDVIRGWSEGLQLMTAGGRTRFWIPARLAYGNDRSKPQGMLVFDVELIEVK